MDLPDRAVQNEWLDTPQPELGGRTPRQAMEGTPRPELPPPPSGADLPPPGRPAWPPEAVRKLLREGTPALRAWAFAWASKHPDLFAASDVACALSSLLDEEDEFLRTKAIYDARRYEGLPQAKALAAVLAAWLPRAREDELCDDVLWVLEGLDAREHFEVFREGLEDEDKMVVESALGGIAGSGHPEAADILLDFVTSSREPALAARAAAAIGELREVKAFESSLRFVIASAEDPGQGLLEVCRCLEETLPASLRDRMESALCEPREEGARAFPLLFPAADPVAAGRARQVVTPEREEELAALGEAERWDDLARGFAALAMEAIDLAVDGDPALGPLGGVLRALSRSINDVTSMESMDPLDPMDLAIEAGTILACAIRGRDIPRERERAGADPEKLLALLRVDDAWLDIPFLASAASALPEERLLPLLEAPDECVHANARAVLAAKNPADHLAPLLLCACTHEHPEASLVVETAGDSVLSPLYEAAVRHPQGKKLLTMAFSSLATERARRMLDHCADAILEYLPIEHVTKLLLCCGSRSFAVKAFERIRAGEVGLGRLERSAFVEEDVLCALKQAAELHALPVDVAEVLEEGRDRFVRSGRYVPEDEDETDADDEEDLDEEGDEDPWSHPSIAAPGGPGFIYEEADEAGPDDAPIEPIQRDAPKIGRNDPCPCGSGKKYKKCCGKEA